MTKSETDGTSTDQIMRKVLQLLVIWPQVTITFLALVYVLALFVYISQFEMALTYAPIVLVDISLQVTTFKLFGLVAFYRRLYREKFPHSLLSVGFIIAAPFVLSMGIQTEFYPNEVVTAYRGGLLPLVFFFYPMMSLAMFLVFSVANRFFKV